MSALKTNSAGQFSYHGLDADDVHMVENRISSLMTYDLYRPDGLYVKHVFTARTEGEAVAHALVNGWKVVR